MKKPIILESTENATSIGRAFSTPVVVKGITWFPLAELIAWGIMAWVAGFTHPGWNWRKRIGTGALTSLVILGSEWCHNLAHAGAARLIGKPMDAMRIAWGMPLVVYYNLNDENVAPRQHITRALGGPLFNAAVLPFILLFRRLTHQGSVAREVVDAAAGMNLFLCTASLLPIPGIDGGPILKWSLVESGHSVAEADESVKKVDLVLGAGLGVAAGIAIKRRRKFLGAILGMFAALALAVGFGLLKEE